MRTIIDNVKRSADTSSSRARLMNARLGCGIYEKRMLRQTECDGGQAGGMHTPRDFLKVGHTASAWRVVQQAG